MHKKKNVTAITGISANHSNVKTLCDFLAFISAPYNQYRPSSKTYTVLDRVTLDVIFLFEKNMKYLLKQNIPVIYVLLCHQKLS